MDVIAVLTGTARVKDYVKKLRKRDPELNADWGTNCPLVAMPGADGRTRPIHAAHTEQFLRLIPSIPLPKAEPFRLGLARVGYERLEKIEDPGLAGSRPQDRHCGRSRVWPTPPRAGGYNPVWSTTEGWARRKKRCLIGGDGSLPKYLDLICLLGLRLSYRPVKSPPMKPRERPGFLSE